MKAQIKAIVASCSEILFLHGVGLGALFIAITLVDRNIAVAGLIAVATAHVFARAIGMDPIVQRAAHFTYNPLLVGLSIGYVVKVTPLVALLIGSAGVATLVATICLANVMHVYFKLPVFTLPFVAVWTVACVAVARIPGLPPHAHADHAALAFSAHLPVWITGFFTSLGSVLFAPTVAVGMLFALLVFARSRILFMLAIVGYYLGACIRVAMLGSAAQAFGDGNAYNFPLIAMAIGGIFLVPSIGSYLLAAGSVAVAAFFLDGMIAPWTHSGVPAFTVPFNLVVLSVVYVLRLTTYPMLATYIGATPEETLENYLTGSARYRGSNRTLHLPFSGEWTVWQGNNGHWTHKGAWRYAYDFVITDELGNTHHGDGSLPNQYYCFRKPVLSPVRGRVVRVVDGFPDTPTGSREGASNWGNLVVIQDYRGFHVEISHFAAKSIIVREGDGVEPGMAIGQCGCSGYSPQPHIHVQVQTTDVVGAPTIPFSFVSYVARGEYFANDMPHVHQQVEPLYEDKSLDHMTSFVLDNVTEYNVTRKGKPVGTFSLMVTMADDGTFCFQSLRGRLYFGKHEGTFYFYRTEGDDPWLNTLFLALPRLPLGYRAGMTWSDYVPVSVATSGLKRWVARFMSAFRPELGRVQVRQTFDRRHRLHSTITSKALRGQTTAEVELDPECGFALIKINDIELRKIRHKSEPEETAGVLRSPPLE